MEKYTVVLDDDNYVLSIGHTVDDDIELDLEGIDLSYINCYQLVKGKLILDEAKRQEAIEKDRQRELKPTWNETIESQLLYTAMMTNTIIGE